MNKDTSINNFNYPGISIDQIVGNPEEYIVPECLEACKKFWNLNIFTVSCSNRRETIDRDGNIKKYIMISHLSDENAEIFSNLAKSNSANYKILKILGTTYYAIFILSKDNIQDRDKESQELLDLVSPFKMQDCLEGFISIRDYYTKNLINSVNSSENMTISVSESELIAAVQKHLNAFGKLDLLDLDRGIIYDDIYYKNAHQRYLEMQQQDNSDNIR